MRRVDRLPPSLLLAWNAAITWCENKLCSIGIARSPQTRVVVQQGQAGKEGLFLILEICRRTCSNQQWGCHFIAI